MFRNKKKIEGLEKKIVSMEIDIDKSKLEIRSLKQSIQLLELKTQYRHWISYNYNSFILYTMESSIDDKDFYIKENAAKEGFYFLERIGDTELWVKLNE